MKIDAINWKILDLLQQNAKLSNTEIAKQVGISSPAVAERIRKMEDAEVIEAYHTRVSYFKAGRQLKAIISVRAFVGRLKPFLKKITTLDEVINCYRITGNENIVMEVLLRDQQHLEEFIDILITYGECKTQIVLSEIVKDRPVVNN